MVFLRINYQVYVSNLALTLLLGTFRIDIEELKNFRSDFFAGIPE